jgi:hypothetical protein
MYAGDIEDNWSPLWGSGVAVSVNGRFVMNDGYIWRNEGGDGVGLDNRGVTIIRGGWIALNQSVISAGAGITNRNRLEFWGGFIFFNEGSFGGGVRNWGDFYMLGGSIQGNIAQGSGGGIFNAGQFFMYNGEISGNVATTEGGGIIHGLSGEEGSGKFHLMGGMIWNNRDQYHHNSGLPMWHDTNDVILVSVGRMGNIRNSHPITESFSLGRRGFFSLDPNETHCPYGQPIVIAANQWARSSGPVPVFNSNNLPTSADTWNWYNRSGTIPAGHTTRTVYFYERPPLTYDPNFDRVSGYSFNPFHSYTTLGRPRVIRQGTDINTDLVDMDTRVPAITPISTSRGEDYRDARPIRGGVTFPIRLISQHTDQGFFWRVFHGHLMAQTTTFDYTSGGRPIDLTDVADWPIPPTSLNFGDGRSLHSVIRDMTPPDVDLQGAWPWQLAGSPSPSPAPLPMMLPQSNNIALELDDSFMKRIEMRIPNFDRWFENRLNNLHIINESISQQERRMLREDQRTRNLIVDDEFAQRMTDEFNRIRNQNWDDGGVTPLTP